MTKKLRLTFEAPARSWIGLGCALYLAGKFAPIFGLDKENDMILKTFSDALHHACEREEIGHNRKEFPDPVDDGKLIGFLEQVEIAEVSGIDQTAAGEVVYKVTEGRKEEFEGMQAEADAKKAAGEGEGEGEAGPADADDAGLALIGALLGLGGDEPEEDPED